MGRDVRPNELRAGVVHPNAIRVRVRDDVGPSRGAMPFGPNTEAVLGLLGKLGTIGPVEAQRLASFWNAVPPARRTDAHLATQAAAEACGRRRAARDAQEAAMQWLGDEAGLLDYGEIRPARGQWIRDWAQLRRDAFPAVLDTIAAAVLSDVLAPAAFEVLAGPWRETFGELELPADRRLDG